MVAIAVLWQCSFAGFRIFYARTNSGDVEAFTTFMAAPFVLAYFATLCYFLHAGTSVLRSLTLDTVSQDKRTYTMSAYLLASAFFMVAHLIGIAFYGVDVVLQSEVHYGLVVFFIYLSRAGTAVCCISMFHAHAGSAFLFMETENARLAEDVRRLEEKAVLDSQLAASENARQEAERETETARLEAERALLEAEKKAVMADVLSQKKLVQKERDINAITQHEVGNPVNVITGATAYLLDVLKAELPPAIERDAVVEREEGGGERGRERGRGAAAGQSVLSSCGVISSRVIIWVE